MKKYILKVKINDVIEEKEFYNEVEAIQELEDYKKNIMHDYTYIALIDVNKNLVLRILYFTSKNCLDLKDGSYIKLKKEYCEETERKNIYIVTNINENNESCSITCINSRLPIPITETVDIKMIEIININNLNSNS